ncbi:MAG: HU family DNA-binding protein [Bacteroidales bacterium]|nr:HU family DNA-binding protein [Bacteroidales bacterium]
MTVKYKIVKQAEPGIKGGGEYKYYLRSARREKLNITDIAKLLEKRSSISRTDIVAVLTGLTDLIPDLLLDNKSVKLGELGIFSLDIKSEASTALKEATWRKIKKLRINFRVGKTLQKAIQGASFERVDV